jgi:hypothetical protein
MSEMFNKALLLLFVERESQKTFATVRALPAALKRWLGAIVQQKSDEVAGRQRSEERRRSDEMRPGTNQTITSRPKDMSVSSTTVRASRLLLGLMSCLPDQV